VTAILNVLRSAAMAISCFSNVPVPQVEWREENMRYMMCFFPLVGVIIGLVLAVWTWLARTLGFGPVLFGAGLALLPILVSGAIHMDGFCDVIDAQSSHAAPERKREILKDPHTGAFAGIGIAIYIVAYVAFATELEATWLTVGLLAGGHVASRCLSGIGTLAYPTSASKGMLSMFHDSGKGRALIVLLIELVVCSIFMGFVWAPGAVAMLGIALVCLILLYPFAKTQFGGMSGDLAGFFLQVAELCMVIALVLVVKVVGL